MTIGDLLVDTLTGLSDIFSWFVTGAVLLFSGNIFELTIGQGIFTGLVIYVIFIWLRSIARSIWSFLTGGKKKEAEDDDF